jgi:hypothetical protein
MGLIYIEYISRRAGVDLARFHAAVLHGQEGWADAYGEDHLIVNAGRTWRLGPEPEYLAVWYTPGAGLERLDVWDRTFRSGDANDLEEPFRQVARIEAAGCYEAWREPVRARGGIYYAEFFRARGDRAAITDLYAARAGRHPHVTLNLLAHRIGRLAPEPGGLALWTVPTFGTLDEIARALDDPTHALELVAAGTYADVGQEIL